MASIPIPLPQVQLGTDAPLIGAQGLGCMGMSEFYGATDAAEALATLNRALELGVTLFDTADMYGMGANETLLGPFIRAHRDRALIATKFGYVRTPANPDDWSLDNRPDYIRAAVNRSLKRLGIETIDLYYMHRRTPEVPLADSIGAMADLVAAGKVRWLGLCEVSAEELRAAYAIHPIAALQSEWSLFSRQIEGHIVPVARDLGVTLVPFAPLGRGLLTGQAFSDTLATDDYRRHFPRFSPENQESNRQLVAGVDRLAAARGITSAQLALAWLYGQAQVLDVKMVPIPGTRKRTRLEENLAALSVTLTPEERATLDPLAAAVQGMRV